MIGPEDLDTEDVGPKESQSVFVPCQPLQPGAQEARVELRHTEEGEAALMVYSDRATLVVCCGEYQPWVAVPSEQVDVLAAHAGAQVVAWNVELPGELQHKPEGEER